MPPVIDRLFSHWTAEVNSPRQADENDAIRGGGPGDVLGRDLLLHHR